MSAIGPGDLVVIVHSCCKPLFNGVLFTVRGIWDDRPGGRCVHCHAPLPPRRVAAGSSFYASDGERGNGCPLAWLRKIEPPKQQEKTNDRASTPRDTEAPPDGDEQKREPVLT